MVRRIVICSIAVLALLGATDAVAKKKKPKILVGPYAGMTIPDGIQITVTLNPGRTTGSITYCSMTAPFTVSGGAFTVAYTDPVSSDSITASGFFSAKKRSVSGSVAPNGCDSVPQNFALSR
jgi:hypothetical protein